MPAIKDYHPTPEQDAGHQALLAKARQIQDTVIKKWEAKRAAEKEKYNKKKK